MAPPPETATKSSLGSAPALVEALSQAGVLGQVDRQLCRALSALDPESSREALLGAALASRAVQGGHVCVDLRDREGRPAELDAEGELSELEWPSLEQLREGLQRSALVSDGSSPTPLVLTDQDLLYLQRYHRLEQRLADWLAARAGPAPCRVDTLRARFDALFPDDGSGSLDAQAVATLSALTRRVVLVSGGPGTGKTTTVARMLALLASEWRSGEDPSRSLAVLLLGPTGKAAQRLVSSLGLGLERLQLEPGLREAISVEAATIHRALGYQKSAPGRFRHDADHPLSADVVVVDEASMVDLALMTRLVEAVGDEARLVMLGDQHQLASVEAGSIFGDLCRGATRVARSAEQRELLEAASGRRLREPLDAEPLEAGPLPPGSQALRDGIVHLEKTYRYADDSGIGTLARQIKAGDFSGLRALLESPPPDVLFWPLSDREPRPAARLESVLAPLAEAGYSGFCQAGEPAEQLVRLDDFRILAAHRNGPFGVGALNQLAERALAPRGLIASEGAYDHRPVLVLENDPQTGLYNGDVGVVRRRPDESARIFFARGDDLASFSALRVPSVQTVFAMTVHKSQGSEFDEVVVVLPPASSPLLTRELLYSAITRARKRLHVVGSLESIELSVRRRTRRVSGLTRRLWGLES